MALAEAQLAELDVLRASPSPPGDWGGKARNLALLRAAGLPCPPGLAVGPGTLDEETLREASSHLRPPFAVRSSASIEDGRGGAAPGLFDSHLDVQRTGLMSAVESVRSSADSEDVRAYCRLRGLPGDAIAMTVVIQEQVRDPRVSGVIYTRPPGEPERDAMVIDIERGPSGRWSKEIRQGAAALAPGVTEDSWRALHAFAKAAETAISATDGADVEWVIDADGAVWLVQARPIVHPTRRRPDMELFEFSRGDDRLWTWDASHNPEPLSPAQAGLVERANAAGVGAELRVVGGYLYAAPAAESAPPSLPADLVAQVESRIRAVVDRALAGLEGSDGPELEDALSAYDRVVSFYGTELAPLVAEAKRELARRVGALEPERARAVQRALDGPSEGHLAARIRRVSTGKASLESLLAEVGPMSPAWDVAAPTYAEDPRPIEAALAIERARQTPLRAPSAATETDESDPLLVFARQVYTLSEEDDLVFFRAQAVVRRALLALAHRWRSNDPGDIFFCELPWILDAARAPGAPSPSELQERAAAGRRRRNDQAGVRMPLAFRNGQPLRDRVPDQGDALRGSGAGGRASGAVLKFGDLGAVPGSADGRVVVALALTPALIFQVHGAAALVSVHGGPLGHGAAMARELGIPCVVECHGAWDVLQEGEEVFVDGEDGWVLRRTQA